MTPNSLPDPTDPSWRLQTMIRMVNDATSTEFQLLEIRASEGTRKEWESTFWALFPSPPSDLERLARSTEGIHVSIEVAGPITHHVKSQYGSYSSSKLRRIFEAQPAQPAPPAPALAAAMGAFERDYQLDQAARAQSHRSTLDRLPHPPSGYDWVPDSGGLVRHGIATFRLWSSSFGYMPGSE